MLHSFETRQMSCNFGITFKIRDFHPAAVCVCREAGRSAASQSAPFVSKLHSVGNALSVEFAVQKKLGVCYRVGQKKLDMTCIPETLLSFIYPPYHPLSAHPLSL